MFIICESVSNISTIKVFNKNTDNMEDWDETKLSEVAEKKHGEADRKRPNQTDIVGFKPTILNYLLTWRCANTLSKRWKTRSTAGFGNVRMVKNVFTDMLYLQDM